MLHLKRSLDSGLSNSISLILIHPWSINHIIGSVRLTLLNFSLLCEDNKIKFLLFALDLFNSQHFFIGIDNTGKGLRKLYNWGQSLVSTHRFNRVLVQRVMEFNSVFKSKLVSCVVLVGRLKRLILKPDSTSQPSISWSSVPDFLEELGLFSILATLVVLGLRSSPISGQVAQFLKCPINFFVKINYLLPKCLFTFVLFYLLTVTNCTENYYTVNRKMSQFVYILPLTQLTNYNTEMYFYRYDMSLIHENKIILLIKSLYGNRMQVNLLLFLNNYLWHYDVG